MPRKRSILNIFDSKLDSIDSIEGGEEELNDVPVPQKTRFEILISGTEKEIEEFIKSSKYLYRFNEGKMNDVTEDEFSK